MSTVTTPSSTHRPTASNTPSLRQATLKKNMSITQTYYLAHKARAKLSREAAQSDHDLRLLVGHANLLDSLMLELADAEREQERWFNQSVRGATNAQQERHVQWADEIAEEDDEDYDSDSSAASDDYDSDDDVEMSNTTPAKPMSPRITHIELDDEEMEEDDLEEDYAQLELVRTHSHSTSPPELVDHDSDSSDEDSMPPSPPQPILSFDQKDAKKQSQQQEESDSFYDEDYYLPPRNPARLVSAISVY
ncbi:hypothetical protein FZEAL_4204 [Fusarium zealandicum]|uniref:Uncharacterized protein n=1 Tax=Fusarium zealandicum TaxID=1053134 RepID=A0A8H4UM94_9HYPO|nr:hypothetical protein FZEAL_4204 [Fusarium zealandicum]